MYPMYYQKNFLLIFIFLIFSYSHLFAQVIVLPNSHSHNDYKQKHPLSDALSNGFTSIEVDVFLLKGELVVAHYLPRFGKKKTLETLYLRPLFDSVNKHNGDVYFNYKQTVILLIDIKSDASEAYFALKPILEKYRSVLTSYENGVVVTRAVTIVLSGSKPYDIIKNENKRFAFIDENLQNLSSENSLTIYLMASTNYSNILTWRGKGDIPADQKQKLINITNLAHQNGKKVRLWDSPEDPIVWQELLNCGVDLINTDKLQELKEFLIHPKTVK